MIERAEMIAEARRLRSEEQLSVTQIQRRLGVTKMTLLDWLRGVPPPDWTKRPNAKDDLHLRALRLRTDGWSVNDIALELGIARSTAWQWVRHVPLDRTSARAQQKRAHAKVMSDARWESHRRLRDERRASTHREGSAEVGPLTGRELKLLGAAIYWCEGTKEKGWRPQARLLFTNSDPGLILLFLRFLAALDVADDRISFRLYIHETADVPAAERWWADRPGVPTERFHRTSLKRHRPGTNRHNVSDDYHGCVAVAVRRSRALYWRIEGLMTGIVAGASGGTTEDATG